MIAIPSIFPFRWKKHLSSMPASQSQNARFSPTISASSASGSSLPASDRTSHDSGSNHHDGGSARSQRPWRTRPPIPKASSYPPPDTASQVTWVPLDKLPAPFLARPLRRPAASDAARPAVPLPPPRDAFTAPLDMSAAPPPQAHPRRHSHPAFARPVSPARSYLPFPTLPSPDGAPSAVLPDFYSAESGEWLPDSPVRPETGAGVRGWARAAPSAVWIAGAGAGGDADGGANVVMDEDAVSLSEASEDGTLPTVEGQDLRPPSIRSASPSRRSRRGKIVMRLRTLFRGLADPFSRIKTLFRKRSRPQSHMVASAMS